MSYIITNNQLDRIIIQLQDNIIMINESITKNNNAIKNAGSSPYSMDTSNIHVNNVQLERKRKVIQTLIDELTPKVEV